QPLTWKQTCWPSTSPNTSRQPGHEQPHPRTLTPPSPRQTLSFLRNLFEGRGIRPKSKLGQNFLIDLNLVDLLLRTAELTRDDLAVEIGTGTGSLTVRLAEQAGAVLGVEVDPAFHILTREAIAGHEDRVGLLHHDVLANKNTLRT